MGYYSAVGLGGEERCRRELERIEGLDWGRLGEGEVRLGLIEGKSREMDLSGG